MLKKIGEPYISSLAPWENDPLERQNEGQLLTRLISGLSGPYVIAVKGDWGAGKSVFLERVSKQLELDSMPVVTVNAWKTDYLEDPLVAFVSAIESRLDLNDKIRVHKDKIITNIVNASATLISTLPTLLLDLAAPGAGVATAIAGNMVSVTGKQLLEFDKSKKTAEVNLKKHLEKTRDILSPQKQKIVFVIDELDRCRPDYAIKVLERIKHYYDVEGIVFVIATDGANLPNAVASVYGADVDGEKYLRKFFDFEFILSAPAPDRFIKILIEQFDFNQNILASGLAINDLKIAHDNVNLEPYFSMVKAGNRSIDAYEVSVSSPIFADLFKLSLRDQAQAFTIVYALLTSLKPNTVIYPKVIVFAVFLRFYNPEMFNKLRNGLEDFNVIFDQIASQLNKNDFANYNKTDVSREIALFIKLLIDGNFDLTLTQFRNNAMSQGGHDLHVFQRWQGRLNGVKNSNELNKHFLMTLNFSNAFISD